MTKDGNASPDPRRPLRIVVEVLATEDQAIALQAVIGAAVCQAPGDHSGPCRIAWTTGVETELPESDQEFAWELLGPVDVWEQEDVDRSLGLAGKDRPGASMSEN